MKQLLLAMLMLTATLTAQSQYVNGVQVTGTTSSLIQKFKAKGWTFVKYIEGAAYMKGSIGGFSGCEMFIYSTKSGLAAKAVVYLPEQNSWMAINDRYTNLVDAYIKKFGEPDVRVEEFEYPYELGDGYESTAIRADKTNINAIWIGLDNANYQVAITKFMQVTLTCENAANMRIRVKEKENSLFD